jgi:hypothetical protein
MPRRSEDFSKFTAEEEVHNDISPVGNVAVLVKRWKDPKVMASKFNKDTQNAT